MYNYMMIIRWMVYMKLRTEWIKILQLLSLLWYYHNKLWANYDTFCIMQNEWFKAVQLWPRDNPKNNVKYLDKTCCLIIHFGDVPGGTSQNILSHASVVVLIPQICSAWVLKAHYFMDLENWSTQQTLEMMSWKLLFKTDGYSD